MQDLDFSDNDEPRTRTTQVRHGDSLARKIDEASRLLGVDKSVFLRAAIDQKASSVIDQQSRHDLTAADAERFQKALDQAPEPTPRALKAAEAYRARVVHAD